MGRETPGSDDLPSPWWEKIDIEEGCSYSTVESYSCKTVPKDDGESEIMCQRIRRRFRKCRGRPVEEVETVIDNAAGSGLFLRPPPSSLPGFGSLLGATPAEWLEDAAVALAPMMPRMPGLPGFPRDLPAGGEEIVDKIIDLTEAIERHIGVLRDGSESAGGGRPAEEGAGAGAWPEVGLVRTWMRHAKGMADMMAAIDAPPSNSPPPSPTATGAHDRGGNDAEQTEQRSKNVS